MSEQFSNNVFSFPKKIEKPEYEQEGVEEALQKQVAFLEHSIKSHGEMLAQEDIPQASLYWENQIRLCKGEKDRLLIALSSYNPECEEKEVVQLISDMENPRDEITRQSTLVICRNKLMQMVETMTVLRDYKFDKEYHAEDELYNRLKKVI